MHPLEQFLGQIHYIHGPGVAETSYYGALETLFNAVGQQLSPPVTCVMQLRDTGAGTPDGGFFTEEQVGRDAHALDEPLQQLPSRGVVEVKAPSEDVYAVAHSEQVTRYLRQYRQVLVTTLREFVLMGLDADGQPVELEAYVLAHSEAEFWTLAHHPRKAAREQGERFVDYLKRVMLHAAPLATPEALAAFLASYAREALGRLEMLHTRSSSEQSANSATPSPLSPNLDRALANIRAALEEALGLTFEGQRGDRFFRSTLVQTLFYGIFSAWVLWHHERPTRTDRFDWRTAAWQLHIPMMQALVSELAQPQRVGARGLDIEDVLNWAGHALNRVDRSEFFQHFETGQAIQYFYEPFLDAFSPQLRKDLGVWYTPPEIVEYMVARVDTVLREDLGLADGLADENVYLLDPSCGTGTYLVAVVERIAATLQAQGDALTAYRVKKAVTERIFGFEIMPAPFIIAHLQLGLRLQALSAPLAPDERAGVYLTNALTGWDPQTELGKQSLLFPSLAEERDAAEHVKRDVPILVVLGNPPYNAYAGVSPEEEGGLVDVYKEGLIDTWGIKKFNLDDLYMRFFRLAERRIVDMSGRGIVCYISNYSWVSEPSFVVLRQHLLQSFDKLWIDNMHSNRKISEYAPDGHTSQTIFAIPGFSSGIQQGIVVSLWLKTGKATNTPAQVLFRDDYDAAKAEDRRAQMLAALKEDDFEAHYQNVTPAEHNRYSFWPLDIASDYLEWPRLTDLCAHPPQNGLMEKRGGALFDIDRAALERRMKMYYNPDVSWEELEALDTGLTKDAARFNAREAREKVLQAEVYTPQHVRRYLLRPFDVRWCYYSGTRPLWNEPRPTLWEQCWEGNRFFMSRPAGVAQPEGVPVYFTSLLGDNDFQRGHAYYIPIYWKAPLPNNGNHQQANMLSEAGIAYTVKPKANLSPQARAYLDELGLPNPDTDPDTAALLWMHALAIGTTSTYLEENADGLRADWPRVPLPASAEYLQVSTALGRRIAALLDTESPVPGVTSGKLTPALRAIGTLAHVDGGQLNPTTDLALTAGWGYTIRETITMPGQGDASEREYTPDELTDLEASADALDLDRSALFDLLGHTTYDVYLNDVAYWCNLPAAVWDYTIGGYQVIKKWLAYREKAVLGRAITPEEALHVTQTARRLAALLLLQPDLNASYYAIKQANKPH